MLNKLSTFIREHNLILPGDSVVCAISGGADSVALLLGLYLLRKKLGISLSAAHFNHNLRGAESDRDQRFVESLCKRYDIPLHIGSAKVVAGEKGLEEAARKARYGFFETLSGKIATAHTADDNAETVLMHLIRGAGLKGLGGITPVRGNIIRPFLSVTRQEVLEFLREYHQDYVDDSTNAEDTFMRNRLRHHVIPLLKKENPRLAENMSKMALRLRMDEQMLSHMTQDELPDVSRLRAMDPPLRCRYIASFLEKCGVKEPEATHIRMAEQLVFSKNPSAYAEFPGKIIICRNYDTLQLRAVFRGLQQQTLTCPGTVDLPQLDLRIVCTRAVMPTLQWDQFTVYPKGEMVIRSRISTDRMRLQGGSKSLKELFIDKKIPAPIRSSVAVIADEHGVLGVQGIGANLDRTVGEGFPVLIRFEKLSK